MIVARFLPLGYPLASSAARRIPLCSGRGATAAQMTVSLYSSSISEEARL